MSGSRKVQVVAWRDGESTRAPDRVANEVPVALTYNRRAHVVMMATPDDLPDFGLGFSLSEGIIDTPAELLDLKLLPREDGIELAMTVDSACAKRLENQRRNLTGRTGCGMCGAESLEQALRPCRRVSSVLSVERAALERAIASMQQPQALQAQTGAVHCAAWCDRDGTVRVVREDVGRHNALDKLIGGLARAGTETASGFLVVSSRASYEMVYKAAAMGAELLLAVSAPTTLAIEFAQRSGLTLVGFARPGRHNVYTCPERITETADGNRDD